MKLSYKVTKVVEESIEVPSHFDHDDSNLGEVVNILVGKERRKDLWSDDEHVIKGAVRDLTEAYERAERILTSLETVTDQRFSRKSVWNATGV